MNKLKAKEYFDKAAEWLRESENACFELGFMTINGKFDHYTSSDTQAAFLGFCTGILFERGELEVPKGDL